ncbi:uncharacterized protein LOC115407140 [Salarias fasciatus]|uniref:uncharacterized protein LOC115407140 n=1 Tax=Salarias fasciatus TaxID=181472 RepID=UPI0011766ED0|nr:uncharacterized protein LOC115407140 [Salarias fasciatus]
MFSTMVPNSANEQTRSNILEALGEVVIANFSQTQLEDPDFVSRWFQTNLRALLTSPSTNFLFCLSSRNFSCATYPIVIQAFNSIFESLDTEERQAVVTHFSVPFLSRNDSSDPGCVLASADTRQWIQTNFDRFSQFGELQVFQTLNPTFSSEEVLELLTPVQLADVVGTSVDPNDTAIFDDVFDQLEDGNALENVEAFCTRVIETDLAQDLSPPVRDRVMNRTFDIIGPALPSFNQSRLILWFRTLLVPFLPSFTPEMLRNTTRGMNCTNYHIVAGAVGSVASQVSVTRQQEFFQVLWAFLNNATDVINTPGCRVGIANDAEFLATNLGPFLIFASYSQLRVFNLSVLEVVDSLSPRQRSELFLDPDTGALENQTVADAVLTSFLESPDDQALTEYFQNFTVISQQQNLTLITNPAVRNTVLNRTLTALAPQLENFGPEDYQLWFQVYLTPVLASLRPNDLLVIPRNISCQSYDEILTGLRRALFSLPLEISDNLRTSIQSLMEMFTRCAVPASFMCQLTPVNEDLICGGLNRTKLNETFSSEDSPVSVCNFTIRQHACSSAAHLTATNLATLLVCSLQRRESDVVELWKLLLQKIPASTLEQALGMFSTMVPNSANEQTRSNILEALGEVVIANFSQTQLEDPDFVSRWFQTNLRALLTSPSTNFLFCLSSRNFSCATYPIVIQAFNSIFESLDTEERQAVVTHFSVPFLSRNDSSDPGCVLASADTRQWIQTNFDRFSQFGELQVFQTLNPTFSSEEVLELLTPVQLADVVGTSVDPNDTAIFDDVFDRLEDGNALENVEAFCARAIETDLAQDLSPPVRDRVMNRTFDIIGPALPSFNQSRLILWFRTLLVPFLPSFTPEMLRNTTRGMNCTNYHIVVGAVGSVASQVSVTRQQEFFQVLWAFLNNATDVINTPGCRVGIANDAEFLATNLGPFLIFASYSQLRVFNLSVLEVVDSLSPRQRSELFLDPDTGALENQTVADAVLTSFLESPDDQALTEYFQNFTVISQQQNLTLITNPAVRNTVLNRTLTALAPQLENFGPEDYQLWFQVYLTPVLASLRPNDLLVIPRNISCQSYDEILTGLRRALFSLPLEISDNLRTSIQSLMEMFTRCAVPASFMCQLTPVNEDLICGGLNRTKLNETFSSEDSPVSVCNFTIRQHACSSAAHLTATNLATLLVCSLQRRESDVVELWKLLLQKIPASTLEQALVMFSTMVPNSANEQTRSNILEALGEVVIANFSQTQLEDPDFVSRWFQTNLRALLTSPSTNFLFCLSSRNFSCATYPIVIQAFNSIFESLDTEERQAVVTHFSVPFLSRNDSSDPGCVLASADTRQWIQTNFDRFSQFGELQVFQTLNPTFSSEEVLELLTPVQLADVVGTSVDPNDTAIFDDVFDRLEDGNALENVEAFCARAIETDLAQDLSPPVRDRVMNRTFDIIGPALPSFNQSRLILWFRTLLVPFLPSFTPEMLRNTTRGMNCTNYHIVAGAVGSVASQVSVTRQQEFFQVLWAFLNNATDVINTPGCRVGIANDAEFLATNLGPFLIFASYSQLRVFNLSVLEVVDSLSPRQRSELFLDPDTGALENQTVADAVLTSFLESPDDQALTEYFQNFTVISQQQNLTLITNPAVRNTVLNRTLTALAPQLENFGPEDYQLWFQVYLTPVLASLRPNDLLVIPRNISCQSYDEILTGLRRALFSLPLEISDNLRTSIQSLMEMFTRCAVPASFMCQLTPVNEDLICGGLNRTKLNETFSSEDSPVSVCNFTIRQHACSSAAHLTATNLATLLVCSLQRRESDVVELWKLLLQKIPASTLEQALVMFSTMVPNSANEQTRSNILEALGEVVIANFSQTQLEDPDFVSRWFQTNLRALLTSPSTNFLFCLSSRNFSCATYPIVIQAFNSIFESLDTEERQAVVTHFSVPFLSRNDSSDPGCVLASADTRQWIQTNFDRFSQFGELQVFQTLNPTFSSEEVLELLTPVQLADVVGTSVDPNDTAIFDDVFDRLEDGNALENVEAFCARAIETDLAQDLSPPVRDRVMNRTFDIIGPALPSFNQSRLILWFRTLLVPFLPSFTPEMLRNTTRGMNCTNYHIVVGAVGSVASQVSVTRQQEFFQVLLAFLNNATDVINTPGCRVGIANDAEFLATNLGPFLIFASYSQLRVFNLSVLEVVDSLSPRQRSELFLDPDTGALENQTVADAVLTSFLESPDDQALTEYFQNFTVISQQQNLTLITNPAVRNTVLNRTLTALAPQLENFGPEDYQLWFQVYLTPVLASLRPNDLLVIPRNISCQSYDEILTGLRRALFSLPLEISDNLRTSIQSLMEMFTRCAVPASFMCQLTPVNEDLICGGLNRTKLNETFSSEDSPVSVCNFTIRQHACSSAAHLTATNLATLLVCSLQRRESDVVELWKLLLQKIPASTLEQALVMFSTMVPNSANEQTRSNILEALGEVVIANFSQTQLEDPDFVSRWFQTNLRALLTSPSTNFLFCLSSRNFSCATYPIVIQAFNSIFESLDTEERQAVVTHFSVPFLSRNDSSDPGCVLASADTRQWIQTNFDRFSQFGELQVFQTLNPTFSSEEVLELLTPVQLADVVGTSVDPNDTAIFDDVFDRLEDGNALENVEAFCARAIETDLAQDLSPPVRDRVMNRTFDIIGPALPSFNQSRLILWFRTLLVPFLPSFTPEMLRNTTRGMNCTNYHIVAGAVGSVASQVSVTRQQEFFQVLWAFLNNATDVINTPGRANIVNKSIIQCLA